MSRPVPKGSPTGKGVESYLKHGAADVLYIDFNNVISLIPGLLVLSKEDEVNLQSFLAIRRSTLDLSPLVESNEDVELHSWRPQYENTLASPLKRRSVVVVWCIRPKHECVLDFMRRLAPVLFEHWGDASGNEADGESLLQRALKCESISECHQIYSEARLHAFIILQDPSSSTLLDEVACLPTQFHFICVASSPELQIWPKSRISRARKARRTVELVRQTSEVVTGTFKIDHDDMFSKEKQKWDELGAHVVHDEHEVVLGAEIAARRMEYVRLKGVGTQDGSSLPINVLEVVKSPQDRHHLFSKDDLSLLESSRASVESGSESEDNRRMSRDDQSIGSNTPRELTAVVLPSGIKVPSSCNHAHASHSHGTAGHTHAHTHPHHTPLLTASPALSALSQGFDLDGFEIDETGKPVPDLFIIHFNDVYNIESIRNTEPVGGADRFYSVISSFEKHRPLILFSGDCFSPSIMSTVTKGKHMVPILNKIGIHCSVFGNHDFDFGMDEGEELAEQTNFPWLMSNVFDNRTDKPLSGGLLSKIIEWNGVRVGLIGLAEKEWIDTLNMIPEKGITYIDFIEQGRKLAKELREQQHCDIVIALTHCREPNDILLAESVPEIDLVLGGHDHFYHVSHCKHNESESADAEKDAEEDKDIVGTTVVKSGCDFKNLSSVEVYLRGTDSYNRLQKNDEERVKVNKGKRIDVICERYDVTSSVHPSKEMRALVKELAGDVSEHMAQIVGYTAEFPFDATFECVRTRESGVGNLMADVVRRAYKADISLLCGGAIRSDNSYGPGPISLKDILLMFPFQDPCAVVELTGSQIRSCLENGVSAVPKLDGRFPQISGMRFVFDKTKEPGQRVLQVWTASGEVLEDEAHYSVATRGYLAQGKDGFTALAEGTTILDEENGHLMSVLLRNFFSQVRCLNRTRVNGWSEEHLELAMQVSELSQIPLTASEVAPLLVIPGTEGRIVEVSGIPPESRDEYFSGTIQMRDLPKELGGFIKVPKDESSELGEDRMLRIDAILDHLGC